MLDTLLDLLFSGVLDRHPNLKIVLVENEVGWLPFALDQWDFFFSEFERNVGLERPPSESFRDHVFATFLTEGNVRGVVQQLGADNIMWSNDYPHGMSTWPHSRDRVRRKLGGLDHRQLHAVLADNVAALYDITINQQGS